MDVHNAIAGLLVGFLVGLTGMGGASLMAPILIFLFHYKAKYAVGSDLAYAAIAKISGSYQHKQAGHVDLSLVWKLAIGSLPASLLGVWVLHTIDKHNGKQAETLITHLLGGVLVLVALVLIARSAPQVEAWFDSRQPLSQKHTLVAAILVGAAAGFLVGLTSIGAGTLFGVALILLFGLRAKKMVGTDIFHGCILSAVAALGHVFAGDVDYGLVGSLLAGAIPGVLIGGYVCKRIPEQALRPTLGTVLLLTGARILG
ncbi:MAG: sulfite exporter TauE/SafE family protein [Capsulimonadaceae bacterium]|nr:sulfite exporter TauE/SafE family protein [Capsulimonadaceae bacterium]